MNKKSICVLGNSSLACLKKAWEVDSADTGQDVSLSFFASSAYSIENIDLTDGKLVPSDPKVAGQFQLTSGGTAEIDLAAYDAICLYGVAFEFRDFMRIFRTHALVEDLAIAPTRAPLSHPALARAIADLYALRPGKRIISLIRSVTDAPIIVAPGPCPAEGALATPAFAAYAQDIASGFLARILDRYETEMDALARRNGWITFLQPHDTMGAPGFTAPHFASNGVGLPQRVENAIKTNKLYRSTSEMDPWHMNEDFGRVVLKSLLHAVQGIS